LAASVAAIPAATLTIRRGVAALPTLNVFASVAIDANPIATDPGAVTVAP
jgi:acyl dehydratase